jgi:HAD superfamily hydrolase (TIGR01549 family)
MGDVLKAVALFDFDMTLMDTSYIITDCTNLLADKFGLHRVTRDDLLKVIGLPIADSWVALWGHWEEEWLEYYRSHFRNMEREGFREFSDTRPSMLKLREFGVKTGVVTNRVNAQSVLEQSGIAPLFDIALGLDDVKNAKPHPEPILTALSRLSAQPTDAFYTGDTPIDMQAAAAAGATGIGVATGNYGISELISAGGHTACPNLTDVVDTILSYIKL